MAFLEDILQTWLTVFLISATLQLWNIFAYIEAFI